MLRITVILIAIYLISSCSSHEIVIINEKFKVTINSKGFISALVDVQGNKNYLPDKKSTPFIQLRIDGQFIHPITVEKSESDKLIFEFPDNISAVIAYTQKPTHLTFELVDIKSLKDIELIAWGPYPTTIKKSIGETVGVVRGKEYAIGIQSLNPKTLGGFPWVNNDCMPAIDIFESDDYSDLSEKGKRAVLYRVEAAKPEDFGSTLQLYCRNRNQERIVATFNHDKYIAPVYNDGGIIGSKIALFGCSVEETLSTIGKIEIAENLPHPMIDGQWGKISPTASAAYLIMDFGEKNIDKALRYTQQAGLRYLYHPAPFSSWGIFTLRKDVFPHGIESMKNCVEKAKKKDIYLGLHTLSNFITTNDPYVSPNPDKRLARVGTSTVTQDISSTQQTIPITSPDFFNQFKNNHLKTVIIGDELIRYGSVTESPPWELVDCQRGAFKTKATFHKKGKEIGKLSDHAYKVFLSNPDLSIEMAKKIAEIYNQTGFRQISFDGLEGNQSTGMGNYGGVLFTTTWFNHLSDDIKAHFIADASNTYHYFWHIYSRMNWGEPWYAGFRESQTEYRLKNQKYFRRNMMPAMLGWFSMKPETGIEDIEWLLARSAAFDAGYAFVTDFKTLKKNGYTDKILELIKQWEKARMGNVFTDEQKTDMEDIRNEFHLETIAENQWLLYKYALQRFEHKRKIKQPGEPLFSSFTYINPYAEQPVRFIVSAPEDCDIGRITLDIGNYKKVNLSITLPAKHYLKYEGTDEMILYSSQWQLLKKVKVDPKHFVLKTGEHTLTFDCKFFGETKNPVKIEMKTLSKPQKVTVD